MRYGFVDRTRYGATVASLEEPVASMPKRGKTSSLKCEEHFHTFVIYFSLLLTFVELCIMNLFHKAKLNQR
jgi:hypothetical protein